MNREAYELDPRMFTETLPPFTNSQSARVAGGLGTVPRLVGEGQMIYSGRIPLAEAFYRIEDLYKPYHRTLEGLLQSTRQQFGYAVLIDCHSMPGGVRPGKWLRALISSSGTGLVALAVSASHRRLSSCCGISATRLRITSPMRVVSSPSITVAQPLRAMPCRLRLIAVSM